MVAGGDEAIVDIDVLRHHGDVLGPVAAPATVWATFGRAGRGSPAQGCQSSGCGPRPHVVTAVGGGRPRGRPDLRWPGRGLRYGRGGSISGCVRSWAPGAGYG